MTNNRVGNGKAGFTLIELMVVATIIIILTLLVVPAFTNIKGAGDVTSRAYTIKGLLEQARTYAMANNTYTWVGFAGSVGTPVRSEEHTSELQSHSDLVCRLLLEK